MHTMLREESEDYHEEVEEENEGVKKSEESSADQELKDLVKKQKLFVEKGSKKEAILKDWSRKLVKNDSRFDSKWPFYDLSQGYARTWILQLYNM